MKNKLIFFLFTPILFCSCNRANVQHYEQVDKLIGNSIVFPDSMRFIDIENNIKPSKFAYDVKTPIKITTNVDGNCYVCIMMC